MAPAVLISAKDPSARATPALRANGRAPTGELGSEERKQSVVELLASAGCVAADEEADELLEAASDDATLDEWIRRRQSGEPLAWITGALRFCDRTLRIDPGVYVPRQQSEALARRAAGRLESLPGRAADICTGAGAIAAHLMAEVPSAKVVGVDVDARAVACARRNGVQAALGDLAGPLRSRSFDVVTVVAPYVPTGELRLLPADVQRFEPRVALDGGRDGLDLVRRAVDSAARLLRPGGWLLVELGGRQDEYSRAYLSEAGFSRISTWHDEDGDLRGLEARLPERH
ncbi:MAG: N5-glutamine methyltransferase family protein [Acidimicrobiales bacterium]